jgi:hypothetical protein
LFFSQRDGALLRLDVLTGQTSQIAKDLIGDVWVNGIRDGRLLITGRINDIDSEFFVDLDTGTVVESAFRTANNRDDGETQTARILFEEDGYFYLEIEQEWEIVPMPGWEPPYSYTVVRSRLGRVTAADYWKNSVEKIEPLEWYSNQDFYRRVNPDWDLMW